MKLDAEKKYTLRLYPSDETDMEIYEMLSGQTRPSRFIKDALLYYIRHDCGKNDADGNLEETVMSAVAKVLLMTNSGQVQPDLSSLLSPPKQKRRSRSTKKPTTNTTTEQSKTVESKNESSEKVVSEHDIRTSQNGAMEHPSKYTEQTPLPTVAETEKVVPNYDIRKEEKMVSEHDTQEKTDSSPDPVEQNQENEYENEETAQDMLDMFDALING